MNFTELSIRKPVLSWMIMAFFIIFGAICFKRMGVSQLPDVDFPMVNVNVTYEGAAPEIMELDVVDILESAIISVDGVQGINSSARRGSANISVEFNLDKNLDTAVAEIQTKISQAMGRLPSDIQTPIVSKINPEDQPILWLAISNEQMPRRDLMVYVRDKVKDQLLSVSGVADVILGGYIDPNLRVWVDDKKLQNYDLSVLDVLSAISSEHAELPGGQYKEGNKEFNVRTLGETKTVFDFENITINRRGGTPNYSPIRLKDVARIEDGLDDVRRISRVNGKQSIGLGIRKIRGTNTVEVGDAVKIKMAEISKILPPGFEIGVNFDSTVFIKDSITELKEALLVSAFLTALVCWLFLGSLGATFNVIISIPTSIIGSFICMKLMNFTLNTFTLLALTLAVGLVVDDNIMILENIVRHIHLGKNRIKASLQGTNEISFAALAASVAIIAIFMPVGFMNGIIGKYFYQFAMTMTFTIIFSYIDAVTLTPMRTAAFSGESKGEDLKGPDWVEHLVKKMALFYASSLKTVLNHRALVLIFSLLFFAGSILLAKNLRKEFSPSQDQGILLLRLTTPPGSSIDFTNLKTQEAEKMMLSYKEIKRYFVSVGGFGGNESSSAVVFVTLFPKGERPKNEIKNKVLSQQEFAEVIRQDFKNNIKGADLFVRDLSQGGFGGQGRGYPVEFGVQGGDWEKLYKLSAELKVAMEKTGKVTDVDSNFKGTIPEIHIIPKREKALARGVSIQDLSKVIRATVSGIVAGKFSKDGRRYDIRVKLREDQMATIDSIKKIQVRNNRGELIPLSDIAEVESTQGLQTIYRENRQRNLSMYANLKPGVSQAQVLDEIKEIAKKVLPPGYLFVESGTSKTFRESFSSLMFVLSMGLLISFMILAAQFNSFIQPLIIMVPLPFSLSGALIALWVFSQSLNTFSMIGIVLLMGIVKKNSIILVDYTNQLRLQNNLSVNEAILEACPIRLRPIVMTSLATIVGALPAAFMTGPGSETRIPMGLTITGGTLISTLLTLYVVPVLYSLISRGRIDYEVRVREALNEHSSRDV